MKCSVNLNFALMLLCCIQVFSLARAHLFCFVLFFLLVLICATKETGENKRKTFAPKGGSAMTARNVDVD